MKREIKPIGVKIIRAEKRDRKIILVFESDLFSDEVFAVTPFYDEGDKKNQLQDIHFNLEVTEKGGVVDAKVFFGNYLNHFTKGHSQLHEPLTRFFINKKDCVIDWILTEKEEWFKEDRIVQILKLWGTDKDFHNYLTELIAKRKDEFYIQRLIKAKEIYHAALKELEDAMGITVNNNGKTKEL